MKRSRQFRSILTSLALAVCAVLILSLLPVSAAATGTTVELTGSTVTDCEKGDTVTITFRIPNGVYLCDFTGLISFDEDLLKPVMTENSDGESVYVDTEVFTAGVVSNLVSGEGIRVAGAKAMGGYEKGGILFALSFKVTGTLPSGGTQVRLAFSVFHTAPTADQTLENTVGVSAATIIPKEVSVLAPTDPAEDPADPSEDPQPTETPDPSQPSTEATEPAPSDGGESTQPSEKEPNETKPVATQPSDQTPGEEDPGIGLIIGIVGAVVVVAAVVVVLFVNKRKK